MVRAITMALTITTARVITDPVITGVRLDTFITTILVGATVTGGIVIGGTTKRGRAPERRYPRISKSRWEQPQLGKMASLKSKTS
jgi:hypothetical protein